MLSYDHLTVAAVKVEGEFLSVVEEEERAAVLYAMIFRAHSQFVSYAVSCAHEFGSFLVTELVSIFDAFCTG